MGSNIEYFNYISTIYGYTSYNEIIELLISGEIEESFDLKEVFDYYEELEISRNKKSKSLKSKPLVYDEEDNTLLQDDKIGFDDDDYILDFKKCKVKINFYKLREHFHQYIISDECIHFGERYNKVKNISDFVFKTFGSFLIEFVSECAYYEESYIRYFDNIDKSIDIIRNYVSVQDMESYAKHARHIPKSFFKVLIEESRDNPIGIFNGVTQRLRRDAEFLVELYDVDPIACVEICKKNNLNWNLFLDGD